MIRCAENRRSGQSLGQNANRALENMNWQKGRAPLIDKTPSLKG